MPLVEIKDFNPLIGNKPFFDQPLLWNTLYKHGWYKQKNVWKKWLIKKVDNDKILRLNENI